MKRILVFFLAILLFPTYRYGETTTILQYFTAYNSKAYIFTLQSFSNEIAPEIEDTLCEIVELTQYKIPGIFTKFKYVLFNILLLVLLVILIVIRKRKTTF